MGERLSAFWNSLKELWARTSRKIRILFFTVLGGILALSLAVVLMLNRTDNIVLYDNLTVNENAGVIAQLQEMGVSYQLEGTRLLIPAEEELNVRMQLATKGFPDSGFGYDIFALGGGLTATQYDKNKYEIFQQQERVQATIKTFPEVLDAHVTISVPENTMFTLQSEILKPTASVKIEKMPGRTLTAEQVQGILNIVRTSWPGLEDENIAISDEAGDMRILLGVGGTNASKLALTEQINETIRRKIMSLLQPVYGDGRVVVAVNSVLDTDQKVTETNTYSGDPIAGRVETEYERSGGTAIAQGVPGANDNVDVPQYAAQLEDDGTGDYYYSHNILDYLVASERNQIIKEGLTITDMTVAVLIDATALPDGERDQVMDLVSRASGVMRDNVSVQNLQFARSAPLEPEAVDNTLRNLLIWGGLALLALIIIFTCVLLWMAKRRKEALAAEAMAADQSSLIELMAEDDEFQPIQLAETQEQKLKAQIRDLAASDPEIVAQLIKTWMMDS